MKKSILLTFALLLPLLATAAPGLTSAVSELPLQLNDEKTLNVSLNDGASYKAIQLDIRVPAGVTVPDGGITMGPACITDHQLAMNKLTSVANTYRVIVQSPTNTPFTSGTDLLSVKFCSDESLIGGKITFTNILMIEGNTPTEIKAPADLVITIPSMTPVNSLSITGAAPVYIDESVQLTAVCSPEGTMWDRISWQSSDPAVATVDENGLVTGVSEGSVTITATAMSFNKAVTATAQIEVIGLRYGDANGDGRLSLADINAVIAYILEMNPQPFSFAKADMNKDGSISVADVTMITDELLKQPSEVAASLPKKNAHFTGSVDIVDNKYELTLSLKSELDVNALQADLTLPAGLSIDDISLCGDISADGCVATKQTPEGNTRLIIYSPRLTQINGNGNPLLKIVLNSQGKVDENAVIKLEAPYANSLPDGDFGIEDFSQDIGNMSGVVSVISDDDTVTEYYTIDGRRISNPSAGIYIVRQGNSFKKTVVK